MRISHRQWLLGCPAVATFLRCHHLLPFQLAHPSCRCQHLPLPPFARVSTGPATSRRHQPMPQADELEATTFIAEPCLPWVAARLKPPSLAVGVRVTGPGHAGGADNARCFKALGLRRGFKALGLRQKCWQRLANTMPVMARMQVHKPGDVTLHLTANLGTGAYCLCSWSCVFFTVHMCPRSGPHRVECCTGHNCTSRARSRIPWALPTTSRCHRTSVQVLVRRQDQPPPIRSPLRRGRPGNAVRSTKFALCLCLRNKSAAVVAKGMHAAWVCTALWAPCQRQHLTPHCTGRRSQLSPCRQSLTSAASSTVLRMPTRCCT